MEILRVPPYNLTVNISVSSPNTEYEYSIQDMADHSFQTLTATSNASSVVTVSLPSEYDGSYVVYIDDEEHDFDVVRPYVDPNTKGTTASEIAEYAKNERIARAIIDAITLDGFYYTKKVLDTVGNGSDYLPVWQKVRKIISVTENNVLVYDASSPETARTTYSLNKDKTAIIENYSDTINRLQGAPIVLPGGHTDYLDLEYAYRGFPKDFDYSVVLATGYKTLPQDLVVAAEMLIEDIACGKMDYYKRYISDYNTDQFKIKFDSGVFQGTGNIIVDKILEKLTPSIKTIGVL